MRCLLIGEWSMRFCADGWAGMKRLAEGEDRGCNRSCRDALTVPPVVLNRIFGIGNFITPSRFLKDGKFKDKG